MFDFSNPYWWRRLIVMILGIVLLGLGVGLFKLSVMGNDPSSAMVMALAAIVNIPFSVALIIANSLFFVAEILMGRHYIGIGTFFNWFGVGIVTDLFVALIHSLVIIPDSFPPRLAIMAFGILTLSLGCALYQTADMGIAPYDVLSIILRDRTPVPYFWCRMFTDSLCAVIAFLFGGIIGLGTLVCAFGLGPFIQFFTTHAAKKLLPR